VLLKNKAGGCCASFVFLCPENTAETGRFFYTGFPRGQLGLAQKSTTRQRQRKSDNNKKVSTHSA
jgi:hypothetical protein